MSRALITCHDHTPQCAFGDTVCGKSKEKIPHYFIANGSLNSVLTQIKFPNPISSANTDTMDIMDQRACPHTIKGNVCYDVPVDVYDLIFMPDCGGAFFENQKFISTNVNLIRAKAPKVPGVYMFHNITIRKIADALKMGGYLIYGKMVYLTTQEDRDGYVNVLNEWFNKIQNIFNYKLTAQSLNVVGDTCFILHKQPIAAGGRAGKSKVRTKSKAKARTKSKARAKSKPRSKSKGRAKSKGRSKKS